MKYEKFDLEDKKKEANFHVWKLFKLKENVGLLLSGVGDLVTQGMEKK